MIWLRRIVAVLLAVVFVALFIPILVVFRVNDTIGNPDFYNDQLRRADIYNFVYTDVAPAALDRTGRGGALSAGGIDLSWARPHILSIVKSTLPPEWLQTQTEQGINAVVPYVLGDTEGFRVNVPLKDRVEIAARSIKDTLHKEDVRTKLYEQAIASVVSAASLDRVESVLDKKTLEATARRVLPPEWVSAQVDNAIDEMVPYFTRDREHFTLRVNITERMDALEAAATDILKEKKTYDYFSEQVLVPIVKQNIQQTAQLPPGMALTDSEILSSVRLILPLEWYQAQVPGVMGQIFSYLKGTRETLEVTIPLADRKPVAIDVLGKLVAKKLESQMSASSAGLEQLLGTILPPLVNRAIPDNFTLTAADLGRMQGGSNIEASIGQARERVRKGLTFTDKELLAALGADSVKIENVRQYLAAGFTFTDADLRNLIKASAETGDEKLQSFDNVRSSLGAARRWKWFAWIIPALILGAIGMLGGRRWSSRLLWAAAVVAVTAAITWVIFGPLFSAVAQPRITEALRQTVSQADRLEALVAGKALVVAQNAIDSFVGGIKSQAVVLMVQALVLIALGSIWHIRGGKTPSSSAS